MARVLTYPAHEILTQMTRTPSLIVKDWCVYRGDHAVVSNLSFDATPGTLVQVGGANGAGKTSLLRSLCGLLHPETGSAHFGPLDCLRKRQDWCEHFFYLGHHPPLKADLSAAENLRYWIAPRRRVAAPDITTALERTGAPRLHDQRVRTMSAGQRRRVALASLLLLPAAIWILDEPTTHLDVAGQRLVSDLIAAQLAGGGIVIAALHHELAAVPAQTLRVQLG